MKHTVLPALALALGLCACGPDPMGPPSDAGPRADVVETDAAPDIPCVIDTAGRSTIAGLAAGADHTCVLLGSSEVACFGANGTGQLGRPSDASMNWVPTLVGDGAGGDLGCARSLAAGVGHTCVAVDLPHASVVCWGARLGEAGYDPDPTEVNLGIPAALPLEVLAGARFSCARSGERTSCWGSNYNGQLGAPSEISDERAAGIVVGPPDVQAAALATGLQHACAVTSDGAVVCWGDNEHGELGTVAAATSPAPIAVPGISDIVSVAAGGGFSCAVHRDGAVSCWGANQVGQLGRGMISDSEAPGRVAGIDDALRVSSFGSHACALRAAGTVSCWGSNDHGQLGSGAAVFSASPVDVTLPAAASELAAGGRHTCALVGNDLYCWGASRGQLGRAPGGDERAPRLVTLGL